MMSAVTYDHRVIESVAEAVQFLVAIKELLEIPRLKLLLESTSMADRLCN